MTHPLMVADKKLKGPFYHTLCGDKGKYGQGYRDAYNRDRSQANCKACLRMAAASTTSTVDGKSDLLEVVRALVEEVKAMRAELDAMKGGVQCVQCTDESTPDTTREATHMPSQTIAEVVDEIICDRDMGSFTWKSLRDELKQRGWIRGEHYDKDEVLALVGKRMTKAETAVAETTAAETADAEIAEVSQMRALDPTSSKNLAQVASSSAVGGERKRGRRWPVPFEEHEGGGHEVPAAPAWKLKVKEQSNKKLKVSAPVHQLPQEKPKPAKITIRGGYPMMDDGEYFRYDRNLYANRKASKSSQSTRN